jgi:hypothetical protein
VLGDGISPFLLGKAADQVGLRIPVLATGILMASAGLVLLAGRGALRRDLGRAARAAA